MAAPGSTFAATYAGWPLMVVRGTDGVLRGFHNVCRHRAGPLVDDGAGDAARTSCASYHGWAYALDGRLRSARDFGDDARPRRVRAARGAARRRGAGQVFVNLDPTAPPLEEDLGDFFAETDDFPIERMTLVRVVAARRSPATGRPTPTTTSRATTSRSSTRSSTGSSTPSGIASTRRPLLPAHRPVTRRRPVDGRWLFRWPNLALNIYGDSMNVEVIVPTGPETCTVRTATSSSIPHAADVADVIALADTVMEQDRRMVEVGAAQPRRRGVRRAVCSARATRRVSRSSKTSCAPPTRARRGNAEAMSEPFDVVVVGCGGAGIGHRVVVGRRRGARCSRCAPLRAAPHARFVARHRTHRATGVTRPGVRRARGGVAADVARSRRGERRTAVARRRRHRHRARRVARRRRPRVRRRRRALRVARAGGGHATVPGAARRRPRALPGRRGLRGRGTSGSTRSRGPPTRTAPRSAAPRPCSASRNGPRTSRSRPSAWPTGPRPS